MTAPHKAVVLISSGLDSMLATHLMRDPLIPTPCEFRRSCWEDPEKYRQSTAFL